MKIKIIKTMNYADIIVPGSRKNDGFNKIIIFIS